MGWDREGVKKISGGGTADLGNQISAVGQDPAAVLKTGSDGTSGDPSSAADSRQENSDEERMSPHRCDAHCICSTRTTA